MSKKYEKESALDYFIAACAIEVLFYPNIYWINLSSQNEEVATQILEESLYKTINFEEFIKIMLTVFENSLKELSVKLYKY